MISEISHDRLTVAVVTKNEEAKILKCLNSIILQTVDIERILLIDSSTDKTIEFAKEIGDKWLEIIQGDFNVGMARFIAIHETKTPLLFFADADSVLEKSTIERLIRSMEINGATMVAPQIVNPLSAFPGAWHAGLGFVSFLPFTAILLTTEKAKSISDKYKEMSCAEDAYICKEILSLGGRLYIDDQISVYHNYPTDIKRLVKKGHWYGTGDAILFRSRYEDSLIGRVGILSRSATFFLYVSLLIFGLLISNIYALLASSILYVTMYQCIYISKFGLLPGMYRGIIELIRSPAWSLGTAVALSKRKGRDYR